MIDNNNDTVVSFQPFRFGMGSFLFTPSSGKSYKALVSIEGAASITVDLPVVAPTGYVMRTEDDNDGTYKVTLTTNHLDRLHGAEIILLAHTRQQSKYTERKKTTNGTVTFSIKKDLLADGVSQLTLFNRELQPVGERLVFRAPKQEAMFSASPDAGSYKTRDAVNVNVTTALKGKPVPANLSLAVYQLDPLSMAPSMDIKTYVYLNSDIRGAIESPEFYFTNDPDAKVAADNLMMTQGWRRFTWNQPTRKTPLPYDYAPEFDGHIVGATVTYTSRQVPAEGLKTYLSVPGNKTQFYASMTDENGKAYFDIRDYYGRNEIVVQADPLADTNYRIDIADPFSERYSVKPFRQFSVDESSRAIIRNHSVSMQALNAYTGDSLTRFDIPRLDSSPFYGRFTKRYLLDDYVRFTTMEEVLREYVPEVGLKRTAGQPRLRIADWNQLKYLEGEPLILFDGVPVTHKQILAYDPLKVRKLEVVTNRYITGKFVFDGIASFNSYAGDMPDFVFDPRTVLADYEGLQLEREFYAPAYDTEAQKANRIGDFRDLLIWQPEIRTDASGKANTRFYTSDKKGKFIGVLQGIDANGNAASHVFSFEVTK
ncbi:MAG: hypothetical protein EOP49_25070 [Sphingobacteriales bacterium]|nr:MAG: hypothetical protein EOP49_25070 [Sphingobacteriales bacterium]